MKRFTTQILISGTAIACVLCSIILSAYSALQDYPVTAQEAQTQTPQTTTTSEMAPEPRQAARTLHLPLTTLQTATPTGPTAPADALYVTVNWDIPVTSPIPGDANDVSLAFRIGYNADTGAPVSNIILAFGRQVDPSDVERACLPSDTWGVQLVRQSGVDPTNCRGIRDEEWVKEIALDYIEGYTANPDHNRTTSIGIGTSNANYPWDCNDPSWREAGRTWRTMIEDIAQEAQPYQPLVLVNSAIDIESWNKEFPDGWVPCGDAAIVWFDTYEGQTGLRPIMNFGSDAFNEREDQWTRGQVYDVFRGRLSALAHPQIYCDNTDTADKWAEYVLFYPDMFFFGVTSENNDERTRCDDSLTWDESWERLNTALNNSGSSGRLLRSVTSFYYPDG